MTAKALLPILLLAVAPASDAAVRRLVDVSYQTARGWSEPVVAEVTFLTGAELADVTGDYRVKLYGHYAVVFFDQGEAAVVELRSFAYVPGAKIDADGFCDLFRYAWNGIEGRQANASGERKWRFSAQESYTMNWIDPRAGCR
jgi:hypothetical protein